jgi:cobalt-zinc-cadmium efflux system outer membrane protein
MRAKTIFGPIAVILLLPAWGFGQQHERGSPTPLKQLVEQVSKESPDVLVAEQRWETTRFASKQASALPETELMVQHVSVGSPRPFAGYSNSDFAYIGFGASQDFPFPGKRALRGLVAERESDVVRRQAEVVRQDAIQRLKLAYFQLAYLQQSLALLEENDRGLRDIEQITESHYRLGQGTQQDVLKAQLQHTKILSEIAMHHREVGELQAELKALLNLPQESSDIITEPLQITALISPPPITDSADLQVRREQILGADAGTNLAAKGTKPDFTAQYMWQHTANNFRDYYMATFGIRLPNRGRTQAAIAEAMAMREQAKAEFNATQRALESEVRKQLVFIRTSEDQLKIYREGLVPQSQATLSASTAAYQSGKQDFETLLSGFNDVLRLQLDYLHEVADHQIAVAKLERLTGVALQ